MINFNVDPKFKIKKFDDILDLPHTIRVNKFDEQASKEFSQHFMLAENTAQEIIPIIIDSYGGQVYSLLSMVDVIKSSKKKIATIIEGKAMSCGAILFSCGAEGYRFMGPYSTLMIHDVSAGNFGKIEEIKSSAAETERLNKIIYTLMAQNVGKPDNYFSDIVHQKGHAEWYLTPEEALYHNLANKVGIPKFNIKLSIDVNFG